jgi:hypothetical protein
MEEIKPCPFCGEPFQIAGDDQWGYSYFHRSDCIMAKDYETGLVWQKKKDVIKALNRRFKITMK